MPAVSRISGWQPESAAATNDVPRRVPCGDRNAVGTGLSRGPFRIGPQSPIARSARRRRRSPDASRLSAHPGRARAQHRESATPTGHPQCPATPHRVPRRYRAASHGADRPFTFLGSHTRSCLPAGQHIVHCAIRAQRDCLVVDRIGLQRRCRPRAAHPCRHSGTGSRPGRGHVGIADRPPGRMALFCPARRRVQRCECRRCPVTSRELESAAGPMRVPAVLPSRPRQIGPACQPRSKHPRRLRDGARSPNHPDPPPPRSSPYIHTYWISTSSRTIPRM